MRVLGNIGWRLRLVLLAIASGPWSLWRAVSTINHKAGHLRIAARQTRRLRSLERYAAEKQLDHETKSRECERLKGEIEALKAEVDGMAAAHEGLLEITKEHVALHRLGRIRYEEGVRRGDLEGE